MDSNDRIIREPQQDEVLFDGASPSTPRIDLILGVALAVIASVLGVVGSLGFAPPLAPDRDVRAGEPVALAAAPDQPEMSAPSVEAPATTPIVVAALDCLDEPQAALDRALCAIETQTVEGPEGEGRIVARMIVGAARLALDEPQVAAEIERMRMTVRALLAQAAEFERLMPAPPDDPAWARTRDLRRAAPSANRRATLGF